VRLVGGAARSQAVREIAPTVFGVPVTVPEPGEYVADGAARQAAWVLTGSRPAWPVEIADEVAPDTRPLIREQYARAARAAAAATDRTA
jgi:xylulokinase